ncbi:MAG TPA: ABC transporter ATP-binding protein [Polyangiaceae bacterium]|nr:ABC transporter ATP-binding protein [Polyangiaceae bacterium]
MQASDVVVQNLTVTRVRPEQAGRAVVGDLSFTVAAGERFALVGPNGAGKTSVLHALIGALPFSGSVRYGERELSATTLSAVRSRVGLVFADPSEQFFLPSARDEVEFGPLQQGATPASARARGARALAAVGLEKLPEARPSELSLGEQRRLALATVLACAPEVILLDEPTAGLDPVARKRVLSVIAATGATLIIATHDLDAVLDLDARVALLDGGRLVALGLARDLLRDRALLQRAGLDLPLSLGR